MLLYSGYQSIPKLNTTQVGPNSNNGKEHGSHYSIHNGKEKETTILSIVA